MCSSDLTGVNEAGITFAVHQNYSRDISLTGVPMVLIGEMVLRYAHDLQEAEEILKKHRPANLWTFVITDLKKGEARAVESSSRHFLTRVWDGNVFAQTNHAMNEKSREWENSSGGFEANSVFRMEQAQKILRESALRGKSELVKALSYQSNASGEMEAYHDILKSETIQTVLFEASPEGDLSLALSAEEAPAPSGQYAEFRLSSLWDGNGSEWIARDFAKLSPEIGRAHV